MAGHLQIPLRGNLVDFRDVTLLILLGESILGFITLLIFLHYYDCAF